MKRFYKFLMPLVAIVAMALPWNVQAQVTCDSGSPVTVSNADTATSTTSYIPGYSLYNYSFTQVLIPAENLTGIGEIKALQFNPTSTTGGTQFTNCEIYLANTELEDLSAGFHDVASDFELVWSGDLSYTTTGWKTIVFDDAFTWDGVSNVIVTVRRNHGSWSGTPQFASFTADAQLARYVYQDGGSYSFGSLPSGTGTTNVAWYRLIGCESSGSGNICYRVRGLAASGITSDGFTLTWIDTLNSGASYTIYDMSDTSVVGTAYDTTFTFTGLDANTVYNYAVVADCGTGTPSSYARITVRTACGTATIPFTEGFEGLTTDAAPLCWSVVSGNPTVQSGSYARTGSNYMRFAGAYVNAIAIPPVDQTISQLQLHFWVRPESNTNANCGAFSVGYMTSLTDTVFTSLVSWNYNDWTVANYEEKEVPLNNVPEGAYVVLRQDAGASNWYWFVDDFVVEPIPACPRPTSVSAGNVTADGADITVMGLDGATFRIYWTAGNTTDSAEFTGSTYTLTGLSSNTLYSVVAVSVCDDGSITNSVSTSFRTLCGGYADIPYTEDFEGYSTGDMPFCWLRTSTGTSGSGIFPSVYNYSSNTRNGDGYFEFESAAGGQAEIAALPAMQNISGLKLIFWASASSSYPCTLEAGVLEDDSTFTVVDTIDLVTFSGTSGWKQNYHEYTVYYADYTGSGERMALRAANTSGQYTLFVDDLSVYEDNGCCGFVRGYFRLYFCA